MLNLTKVILPRSKRFPSALSTMVHPHSITNRPSAVVLRSPGRRLCSTPPSSHSPTTSAAGTAQAPSISPDKLSRISKRSTVLKGQVQSGGTSTGIVYGLLTTVFALISGAAYEITNNPDGTLGAWYKSSALRSMLVGVSGDIFEPESDKLLPDWGSKPFYEGVPPGTPAPPVLVLDLEKTLIGSVHDGIHGWRHVRRPGIDNFLQALSQYYEIVIFSDNDLGMNEKLLMAVDKNAICHKFGPTHGELRGDLIVKRLDYMNRDIRRIILIDDNPAMAEIFPGNTILVKPFDNIEDTTDHVLEDLVPVLQAFVHDGCADYRAALDDLGTHQAEELVVEYHMRVNAKREEERQRRNKGLGRLLRPTEPSPGEISPLAATKSSVLSISDIVGVVPVSVGLGDDGTAADNKQDKIAQHVKPVGFQRQKDAVKKKGALFEKLDSYRENQELETRIKQERMNEIYMRKMQEKNKQQQQAEQS